MILTMCIQESYPNVSHNSKTDIKTGFSEQNNLMNFCVRVVKSQRFYEKLIFKLSDTQII